MKFDTSWRIVLWGHKLHQNTFSYVNYGFERAARHLGFPTRWLDDGDYDYGDLSHSIFFTEGQVQARIPLLDDCFYVLHNVCGPEARQKYQGLYTARQVLDIQTITDERQQGEKLADFIYFSLDGRGLHFPWATDLLPHEIDAYKPTGRPFNVESKVVTWVGTVGDGVFGNIPQLNPFMKACQENGIQFRATGLWGGSVPGTSPSCEQNAALIRASYMAPAIVGGWQQEKGYIPCRAFKNISYGQPGMTNSPSVKRLFGDAMVFNPDSHQLFYDARARFESLTREELIQHMDWVRDNHTYLNRLTTVLTCLERIQEGK